MHIVRLKPGAKGAWFFSETSRTDTGIDEFQRELATKEPKVEKYLEQCSSVWLLIVIGGRHVATIADLTGKLKQHRFESHFERIVVYNRLDWSVTRLLTSQGE